MRIPITIFTFRFVMFICCILCFSSVHAQQKKDLVYRHGGFGLLNKKYFLNDVKITKNNVAKLLEKENEEAYMVFKAARSEAAIAIIIALPSSTLLAVGSGSYLFSGWGDTKEQPGLLIAGVAGTTGAIILAIVANNKFKMAADIYSHTNASTWKTHLNFGLTRSGRVGLTASF